MIVLQTEVSRLMLALVLGALVGLERETGARAAGIPTHGLVAALLLSGDGRLSVRIHRYAGNAYGWA